MTEYQNKTSVLSPFRAGFVSAKRQVDCGNVCSEPSSHAALLRLDGTKQTASILKECAASIWRHRTVALKVALAVLRHNRQRCATMKQRLAKSRSGADDGSAFHCREESIIMARSILITAIITLAFLSACGPPAPPDVDQEILATGGGVVGKIVVLKTSPSLKSGSLADVSQIWINRGWKKIDPAFCKPIVPDDLVSTSAFELDNYLIVSKDRTSYKAYVFRICAKQMINPKRITAFGLLTSVSKPTSIKP